MTKRIVFGMVVALAAFEATPSASAACIPAKTAVTFGGPTAYWLPATAVGTAAVQSWQLGSAGTWQGTGCPDSFLFPDGPGFSLNYNLGGCGAGCPAPLSTLAVLAMNKTPGGTEFLLDTIVETPADPAGNFNYGSQGDHTMIPIPHPRVTASGRSSNNVNLIVNIDAISAGLFGPNAASAVSGFKILKKSSATDPGQDAASYDPTPAAVFANAGGTGVIGQPVVLDCTNLLDQWIVTQIQFENGTVLSNAVSQPTRVRCDPALANPKFNVIPKKIGAPRTSPN